jgi:hypothetical protein
MGIPLPEGGVGWPAGFKRVCVESEAAGALMAVCVGLGLLGIAVVAWAGVVGRRIGRERSERWEGKWRS